jgi:hypothetical protein
MDYAALKSQLDGYTHRTDLGTEYDTWIALVESELNLELRLRQQMTSTTLTATSDTVALPSDFLQMVNLELATNPVAPLHFVTSEQRDFYDLKTSTGQPRIYDIIGSNIILAPQPDQTYTLNIVYYAAIPTLPSNTTNWLITNFPHVYLYGCLSQAGAYITDTERLQIFVQAYTDAKAKISKADDDAVYNSSPRMRADVGW